MLTYSNQFSNCQGKDKWNMSLKRHNKPNQMKTKQKPSPTWGNKESCIIISYSIQIIVSKLFTCMLKLLLLKEGNTVLSHVLEDTCHTKKGGWSPQNSLFLGYSNVIFVWLMCTYHAYYLELLRRVLYCSTNYTAFKRLALL